MTTEIRVPWATLLKILAAVALAWAVIRLWPSFQLFLLSALLAVGLSPIVDALERRGLARGYAVALVGTIAFFAFVGLVALVVPALTSEISVLWKSLPTLKRTLAHQMEQGGLGARVFLPLLDLPRSPEFDDWLAKPLAWGPAAVGSLAAFLFAAVLSLYLVLDGPKVLAWLLAYMPRAHRIRMAESVPEVFVVLRAYVVGQLVTSVLFGLFAFGVLVVIGVPAALPLALLAFVCDAIPVVGILIATAPAALIALTVRPSAAVLVTGLYLAYHLIETYLLIPRLYGNRLRLSTLTVLLALVVGATLGGVAGALLALPIAAAYPVIERRWLRVYLHPDVAADHGALRAADDTVREGEVVETVIRGGTHGAVRP